MALSKRAREARNKYQREWRKAHPDLHRAYIERSWENRALRERMKKEQQKENNDNGQPS